MISRSLLAAMLALLPTPLLTQPSGLSAGGYVDYLLNEAFPENGASAYDHLLHIRLNTQWYPFETLTGVLEIRARAYYGSLVRENPGFADQLKHDPGVGPMGLFLWKDKESVAYGEIDRCYGNWNMGSLQVTLGRQRIAWGTNLVWNPIDLFNPLSILDFDYVERPAADAIRCQYYTGEVSKIELAVKPGNSSSPRILAAQWSTNQWKYDFHFLAGWKGNAFLAGAGWAGDIAGGGFRGEILTSKVATELRRFASDRYVVTYALSGDYTFPNSFYIHAEVLYNSEGYSVYQPDAIVKAETLGMLSPARWSLYQEFGFNVSPLVRASVFGLFNPQDPSLVAVPSVTWAAATNLDITLLAMLFSGAPNTEYGQIGTTVFGRCIWSF